MVLGSFPDKRRSRPACCMSGKAGSRQAGGCGLAPMRRLVVLGAFLVNLCTKNVIGDLSPTGSYGPCHDNLAENNRN